MSKVCTRCGVELTTPIEEYRAITEPLCWSCYSNPDIGDKVQETIDELKEDIEDLESEIDGLQDEISDKEDDILEKQAELARLQGNKPIKIEKEKLQSWVEGKARR